MNSHDFQWIEKTWNFDTKKPHGVVAKGAGGGLKKRLIERGGY